MKTLLGTIIVGVFALSPIVAMGATEAEVRSSMIVVLQQLIELIEDQIEEMLDEEVEDENDEETEEEGDSGDEDEDVEVGSVETSSEPYSIESTGELQGVFTVTFPLSAVGNTMYIPVGATLNTETNGATYVIEDPNTGSEIGAVTDDNIVAAYLTSNADEETNGSDETFYRINEGDTEEFTLHVQVGTNSGTVTGPVRVQLESVRFTNDVEESPNTFQLFPRGKYETGVVTLSN